MAIAISLFVVFLALFVVMISVKRDAAAAKTKAQRDGSTGLAIGGDTGGARKGASDSDGQDGGDGGGGD